MIPECLKSAAAEQRLHLTGYLFRAKRRLANYQLIRRRHLAITPAGEPPRSAAELPVVKGKEMTMRVQKAIEINAPPERIWPFFVESEKVLQWYSTFRRFEYTSNQRSGVGTHLYIEEQAGGPLMKIHFEATEWKENEKLALRMVSGSGVKSYKQTWLLETIPSGSRFTFMEEIEFPLGFIGKLIGLIGQRMSEATVNKIQLKLKTLAEA